MTRRFKVRSKTTGKEFVIGYSGTGVLCLINAEFTDMKPAGWNRIMEAIPLSLGNDVQATLLPFCKALGADLTEMPPDVSFDKFWALYGKKINRKRAEVVFNKLSNEDKFLAILGIKKYDWFLTKIEPWRSKADPETYLKNRMYENEW